MSELTLSPDEALLAAWLEAETSGRPFDRANELYARLAADRTLDRAALDSLELDHLLRRSAAAAVDHGALAKAVMRALAIRRAWRRRALAASLVACLLTIGLVTRRPSVAPVPALAADCQVEPVAFARYAVTGPRAVRLDAGELRLAIEGAEPVTIESSIGTIRAEGRTRLIVGAYPSPPTRGSPPMPSTFMRALVLTGAALLTTPHGAVLGRAGELLAGEPDQAPRRLAQSHAAFALALHRELARRSPDANLIAAPHSVAAALALAYLGARGETSAELARVLHLPREEGGALAWEAAQVAAAQGALDTALDDPAAAGRARVATAAALWADRSLPLRKELVGDLERARAGLFALDFTGDPEGSRRAANAWIARRTDGKVTDLVSPEAIAGARLLLTTAVTFKGEWTRPFDTSSTRDREFVRADGSKVMASSMSHTNAHDWPCAIFDAAGTRVDWTSAAVKAPNGFRAAELGYKGDRFGLLVLLPNHHDGLPALERTLDATALERIAAALEVAECEVVLPKLDLSSRADLRAALEALGLVRAFSPESDLGGLVADGARLPPLGAVEHSAFLRCDERGTEAGGATAIPAGSDIMRSVVALRPFVFVLRDRQTGAVLFTGRVMDPRR